MRLALLAAILMAPAFLRAEEACDPKLAASLDLLESRGGTPVVAVTFNGRPAKMVIDTGASWSGIVPSAAAGLKIRYLPHAGMIGAGGGSLRMTATVRHLQIGGLAIEGADYFIFARDGDDPALIGNIGANILRSYDLDIDYAGRKVRFFQQGRCSAPAWADGSGIPFKLTGLGHISLPVTLDGHGYDALLDTGATASYIDSGAAAADFGLEAEQANAIGLSKTLDGKDLPTFYHRFSLLEVGGVSFREPKMALSIRPEESAGWGQERIPSVILGMHHLRATHLFISYRDRILYLGPPTARPPLDAIDIEAKNRLTDESEKEIAAGRYAKAASLLTEALALAPEAADLYSQRGYVLLQKGDDEEALGDLDRAHLLAPTLPEPLLNRAYLHLRMKDVAAALADLDALILVDPGSGEAFAERCALRIEQHHFDGALPDCDRAIALGMREPEVRLDRAFLHMLRKELDLARADCDDVLAENPRSEIALSYLGQIKQAVAARGRSE